MHNQRGEKVGTVQLPNAVFAVPVNKDLLHQVVVSQMSNLRQNIAHTKDRSEVRGGGRKPWKQKGTGRARHGSIRSPIWKGGGATFGPRSEKNYKKKINRKMAQGALAMALSAKIKDQELVVVDKIDLTQPKTKEMAHVLNSLANLFGQKTARSVLIITSQSANSIISRVSANLPTVDVRPANQLSALSILARKHVVLLKEAADKLASGQA